MNKVLVWVIVFVVLIGGWYYFAAPPEGQEANTGADAGVPAAKEGRAWKANGGGGLLVGGYGDNFAYDGTNVRDVVGSFNVDVDSAAEKGRVEVVLQSATHQISKDKTLAGEIKLVLTFAETDAHEHGDDSAHEHGHSDTPASADSGELAHEAGLKPFMQGGIAEMLHLHGDTGQGPPVMPKVWTYLAGWGELDIFVDGALAYDNLAGHFMVTEQARQDKKIQKEDGTVYSPALKSESGFTNPEGTEFHIVAHSHGKPDEGNFPPDADWIHLNFQEVNWTQTPQDAVLTVQ